MRSDEACRITVEADEALAAFPGHHRPLQSSGHRCDDGRIVGVHDDGYQTLVTQDCEAPLRSEANSEAPEETIGSGHVDIKILPKRHRRHPAVPPAAVAVHAQKTAHFCARTRLFVTFYRPDGSSSFCTTQNSAPPGSSSTT